MHPEHKMLLSTIWRTTSFSAMSMIRTKVHRLSVLLSRGIALVLIAGCKPGDRAAIPMDRDSTLWNAMLAAEDARIASPEAIAPLLDGVRSGDPVIRAVAVRALGRMEQPSLVQLILPLVTDSAPLVRMEAVNALGQAVYRGEAATVATNLLTASRRETDASTRGVIFQTLGRLPYESVDTLAVVERALSDAAVTAELDELVGVARGLESFVRLQADRITPSQGLVETLYTLADYHSSGSRIEAVRVRRLAVASLVTIGRADRIARSAIEDEDPEVRRLAVGAVRTMPEDAERDALVAQCLKDESPIVRYATLRALRGDSDPLDHCSAVMDAVDDPDPHVSLLVIDLIGDRCENNDEVTNRLFSIAEQWDTPSTWHKPAHALVSLAKLDATRVGRLLPRFAAHESPWVRMYAAYAATTSRALPVLARLASDEDDNVRQAVISGLSRLTAHDADSIYVAQLERRDYQLIMTAAGALEGSPNRGAAVAALLDALERITAERRETSRDVRRAILQRIQELGGAEQVDDLRPYLADFDSTVAREAAQVLTDWVGSPVVPSPVPLPPQPLPSFGELVKLVTARATLVMREGGSIELRLLPFEAPTNAARFSRLAREGYFDGLTFHRIAPGFVVQGGSPGANEYAGDGPYTRDELTRRSHLCGTVGVSTRGRDTGDAQLFINLVDNPRLDHNYTIFAEVVRGMEVVDGLLEGAVIDRIVWR
jgi:cyclophilin family peptidyl-prolyl cis-trans isomerase/HEAT repeat protein